MIDRFPDDGAIRFHKIRDAGGILNASFVLLRRNAREAFLPFLAIVVPFALIIGVGQALYMQNIAGFTDPNAMIGTDFEEIFSRILPPWYIGVVLMSFVATAVAQAAAAGYIRLYRDGASGTITATVLWEETRGLILPTIGFSLAYGALMMLGSVIILLPCLGALVWVGALFWSLPYAMVAWCSRMTETRSLAEAVGRSRDLVKGSWPFAFGTMLLVGIVTVILVVIGSLPAQVASQALMLGTADATVSAASLSVLTILGQLVGYGAYLLPVAAGFFLHGRLTAELDGTHLDEELDLFERGVQTTPQSSWDTPRTTRPAPPPADGDSPDDDSTVQAPPPPPSTPPSGGFRGGGFDS